MRPSGTFNKVLKTFIGCAILFLALTINHLIRETIKHDRERKTPCADFAPVDGAGRPEYCK